MFADMRRYIALLRGINISGKNKVPMAELKKGFETLAFVEVKTYLNSGNVIFSSDEDNIRKLTDKIEEMIKISLDWIFLFLSCQGKRLRIFYKMRPTGGAVRTKKSMII